MARIKSCNHPCPLRFDAHNNKQKYCKTKFPKLNVFACLHSWFANRLLRVLSPAATDRPSPSAFRDRWSTATPALATAAAAEAARGTVAGFALAFVRQRGFVGGGGVLPLAPPRSKAIKLHVL